MEGPAVFPTSRTWMGAPLSPLSSRPKRSVAEGSAFRRLFLEMFSCFPPNPARSCNPSPSSYRVHVPSTRREFIASLTALAATRAFSATTCPFHLSVINDELTPDFGRACEIATQDFGLHWIELRAMWNKNVTDLDAKEIAESCRILEKYQLRVTDVASPLFKVDWPGAPLSKERPQRDQFHADFDFKQQDQLLEHCIELAKQFKTDRIRCFDFWRLDDQAPYRAAINDKLRAAAETCAKSNMILLLENEMSCNTATGKESAAVLKAIPNKNFMLNWDPGQCRSAGEHALSRRLSPAAPRSHRSLPRERCRAAGGQETRMGARRREGWSTGWANSAPWLRMAITMP